MAPTTSFGNSNINSGIQLGENNGNLTVHLQQPQDEACLRDLRTTDPRDDKNRIEQTKGGLLKDSYRWVLENDEFKQWQTSQNNRPLWIRGDPGKGKTMLLCGIIDELALSAGDSLNLSFFFCQASDARINNATAVLRGLIFLLVEKQPSLLSYVRGRYDSAGKAVFEDKNASYAISEMFTQILRDPALHSTCFIIDALDECTADLNLLLRLIIRESSPSSKAKWIVSSRNWPRIAEQLEAQVSPISLELNEASVCEAVKVFIHHKVELLATAKKYSETMRDGVSDHLLLNSQGTFLWVALVCQELTKISRLNTLKRLKAFPAGLNDLYNRMIDDIWQSDAVDAEVCLRVLSIISTLYRPPTVVELKGFLEEADSEYQDEDISEIVNHCGSFLTTSSDDENGGVVRFVHQSAQDFLRLSRDVFPRGPKFKHHEIFIRSLLLIIRTLKKNIYNVDSPGLPAEQVRAFKPHPDPLMAMRYACIYWVDHLKDSDCEQRNDTGTTGWANLVDRFLQEKYLHWLEALGILGDVNFGILAMLKLETLLKTSMQTESFQVPFDRAHDASRFFRAHRVAIEISPLQVYSSCLLFSPMKSLTRVCYERDMPDWISNRPSVEENWSPCIHTLEGHGTARDGILSVAWSTSGQLASAEGTAVKIWNSETGQCLFTLTGHSDEVNSVAWSPDGSERLASCADDATVKIWDSFNGQCIFTLSGHTMEIESICWSNDGRRVASSSRDQTIKSWDAATGLCVSTLECYTGGGIPVTWSPGECGRLALSTKNRRGVDILDPATCETILTLSGFDTSISSVAWSTDGTMLAIALIDGMIEVWRLFTDRGERLRLLDRHKLDEHESLRSPPHEYFSCSMAWSRDGRSLASSANDKRLAVWDVADENCLFTLKGHSEIVWSVVFSPDGSRLTSSSDDGTIKIWDLASAQSHAFSTSGHHGLDIECMAWSPDSQKFASGSKDDTIIIWDPANGECLITLRGHENEVKAVQWASDGRQISSWSFDGTLKVWETVTGQCKLTISSTKQEIHTPPHVISHAWSPDGKNIATGSTYGEVHIWDSASGKLLLDLGEHWHSFWLISWSPDGSRLACTSSRGVIKIWDTLTAQCTMTLKSEIDTTGFRSYLISWSSDGHRVASCEGLEEFNDRVLVWDLATGKCIFTLDGLTPPTHFLRFDDRNPSILHSSWGVLDMNSPVQDNDCHRIGRHWNGRGAYNLSETYHWITYNGENVLWLPPDYRPQYPPPVAISGTKIAINCPGTSHRVVFLEFADHSPLVSP